MAERPDFKSLAARIINRGTTSGEDDHPVDTFLADEGRVLNLAIALLRPNPDQPRKHFDPTALDELTASVKEKGILQPVIARKDPDGRGFILIAGERRWRAAQAAGLTKIPALIRSGEDALEVAIIENLQRDNLNPMEEAEALMHLKTTRAFTDATLAKVVGKSRSSVTEILSLNSLPEEIRNECRTSDDVSKSQLLEIARAGSPEAINAAWSALRSGEASTVRQLRENARGARPKRFQHVYTAPGQFRLTITFTKPEVHPGEIRDALSNALDQLS